MKYIPTSSSSRYLHSATTKTSSLVPFFFFFPLKKKKKKFTGIDRSIDRRTKMMHMTLYWGKEVTLLIKSWKTHTWTSYLLTLLACFLFSAFYQYLEDRRLRFKALASSAGPTTAPSIHEPLLSKLRRSRGFGPLRFATAILFGVNSAIGYLLMLAIMSFNGGVFITIVLGLSVGYFLFRSVDEEIVAVDNPCACA